MLQKLREKTTGWLAVVIVAILVVPFAFFGVNNYFSTAVSNYVAKVGEVEISADDFRVRFDQYREQQRRQLGERFDPQAVDNPIARRELLERMIDEELLAQTSERLGLAVTPAQLRDAIAEVPAFQVEGRFDPTQYQLLLTAQAMTPRQYESQIRRDLEVRTLPIQLIDSAFLTDAELDDFVRLADQTRDIEYLAIMPPTEPESALEEDAALAWYDENRERYRSEETVAIEYVELSSADIEVASNVDEQTLRERYEEQRDRFVEPEQRLISHILIKLAADADAVVVAEAETRARGLIERITAGEDFAAVASEASDDLGSRASGGELGWLEAGLLDTAVDAAVFAAEPGLLPEPVRSAEGWHVLKLAEIRPGNVVPFEDVRAELERAYLDGERERAFSETSGRLIDATYRDPTALATVAESLGLRVQTSAHFSRQGGEGITGNPEVIAAAFSRQVIEEGLSSDSIELGPNHIVILRVVEHVPSEIQAFEDVRERVEAEALADRRAKAARARADALFERLKAGATLSELAAEAGTQPEQVLALRRFAGSPDRAIVEAAFSLPAPSEGVLSHGLAESSPERFTLITLAAVTDGDPSKLDSANREAIRRQLSEIQADLELRAFVRALRDQIPVVVVEDAL